jgi:hypothetical protein
MDDTINLIDREPKDTNDKDSVHDKSDIIEGFTSQEGKGYIIMLLMFSIPLSVYFFKTIYSVPYKFFKYDFGKVLKNPNYNKEDFTSLYDEYEKSFINKKSLNHKWVLMLFLGASYMAFLVNSENMKDPSKWVITSTVGAMVFILKFVPSIMSFFENVFGYIFMNLFGSVNLSLSLKNNNFKDGVAHIKLNQLTTIFDVENLGKKFNQIGIYNGETKSKNDGTLFATFNENPGKDTNVDSSTYQFFEGLLDASILKRAIGNTSMLIITTFISIGMLKHFEA